jgi:MSHA pilin protein MshC
MIIMSGRYQMRKLSQNWQINSKGFTLIELVMVMVLVGILSVAIIPRFANKSAFDAKGFFDQSSNMIRYAQKVAIAQRRDVFVNISPNTICLTYVADTACTSVIVGNQVINPADQAWFKKDAATFNQAGGVFGATTSFSFNALGKPSAGTSISLTADSVTQTIKVETDTGYVH